MGRKGLSLLLLFAWLSGALAFAAQDVPLEVLHNFARAPYAPNNPLIKGIDGNYYGTTGRGGAQDGGTVYRLSPDGETTLVASLPNRGFAPRESANPLTLGKDGQLYGILTEGGTMGRGAVFRIKNGVYETFVDFGLSSQTHGTLTFSGRTPRSPLLAGLDGYLYGTTEKGGTSDRGTIFRIATDGTITKLYDFGAVHGGGGGLYPMGALIQTSDGTIYGTTREGGSGQAGTVFKLTANGTILTLFHFNSQTGAQPENGLFEGPDSLFYGTTSIGGSSNGGTLFSISTSGIRTVLANFQQNPIEGRPGANLVFGPNGSIFGLSGFNPFASSERCRIFKYAVDGSVSFMTPPGAPGITTGLTDDGSGKLLSVLERSDGTTLGTGIIFRMSATGEFETGMEFKQLVGAFPSSILRASDGTIYGSTLSGGASNAGTLFKIAPNGSFSTLASFDRVTNGSLPQGLRFGADGRLYGITSGDSASVFRLNDDNTLSVIHSYNAETGLESHWLTVGLDGAFYFTTYWMGPGGGGTILRLAGEGPAEMLHSFNDTAGQPRNPASKLFLKPDGSFIATLWQSGEERKGAVYQIDSAGTFATLGTFTTDLSIATRLFHQDGNFYGFTSEYGPESSLYRMTQSGEVSQLAVLSLTVFGSGVLGLTEASDHQLYGMTGVGSPSGSGTIFRATLNGTVTPLAYRFQNSRIAFESGLFIDGGDGYLYSAQAHGGPEGGGVVFRFKLPPTPSVITRPATEAQATAATLRAVATNSLFEARVRFEYGTDSSYGSSTPEQLLSKDLDELAVAVEVGDLSPTTTYHYRVVMVADSITYHGEDLQFTTAPNHAPVAVSDISWVRSQDSILLDVTANDHDADGHALVITTITQGRFGTVSKEANMLRYSPGSGFSGSDSFTYTITDGLASTTATVQIRNPLYAVQGVYQPLLLDGRSRTRGTLKLTLSPSGDFTARAIIKGIAQEFSGSIGLDGRFSETIELSGKTVAVQLLFDVSSGSGVLNGTISVDGSTYSFTPEHGTATAETAAAFAGRHNAVFTTVADLPPLLGGMINTDDETNSLSLGQGSAANPLNISSTHPTGTGWVSMVVRPNGTVRLAGVLGDGLPFTAGAQLRGDGSVPVSIRLSTGRGDNISGKIQLAAAPGADASGTLYRREAPLKNVVVNLPFADTKINVSGSRYISPAKGEQSLTYSSPTAATADLRFTLGDQEPISVLLDVSLKETVLAPSAQGVQMTINRATGLFRGVVKPVGIVARKTSFSGVVLQSQNRGEGLFGRGSTAGTVSLLPR